MKNENLTNALNYIKTEELFNQGKISFRELISLWNELSDTDRSCLSEAHYIVKKEWIEKEKNDKTKK